MKRIHCEVCEAPLPAGKRRGKPQRFCSEACRKVAQRRRTRKEGQPRSSDRGRVSFEAADMSAYDEGLIPFVPMGQIEAFNAQQAREKPWRARVYGGKKSKGGGDDG